MVRESLHDGAAKGKRWRSSVLDGVRPSPYVIFSRGMIPSPHTGDIGRNAMAVLPVIIAPDPRLKIVSEPVETVDGSVRQLMDDMAETMYAAPGCGLAAPQVGVSLRVFIIDVASTPHTGSTRTSEPASGDRRALP